jgi:hypothetical protein
MKRDIIFVYCPEKVGSTSLVSSLRLWNIMSAKVIHIHGEDMLKVLTGVEGITVNDIIRYNRDIGNKVIVIDIYRTPIEQKMSLFFEKISTFHFNNEDRVVNNFALEKVVNRFNNLFPHLKNEDYLRERYDIDTTIIPPFDFVKKYIYIDREGIRYIKIRLQDVKEWGRILLETLGYKTGRIVMDYETEKKEVGGLYRRMKEEYKIPRNNLEEICRVEMYYLSEKEKKEYIEKWSRRVVDVFVAYNEKEYKMYKEICRENGTRVEGQRNHYIDEGCICKQCVMKRMWICKEIEEGREIKDIKIDHNQITYENKVKTIEKKNNFLKKLKEEIEKKNRK